MKTGTEYNWTAEVVKVVVCRGYTAAVLATEAAAEHEDSLGLAAFRCILLCTTTIWEGRRVTLHKSPWLTLMEKAPGGDGISWVTVAEREFVLFCLQEPLELMES